jgi:hypothetical protein
MNAPRLQSVARVNALVEQYNRDSANPFAPDKPRSRYQAVGTGQLGPVFDTATAACLWIIQQPNVSEWDWGPVTMPATHRPIQAVHQTNSASMQGSLA